MTYAMTLDNSWELMSEDEMYDVNGGFLGWSETKFMNNMVVIAQTILTAVATMFGSVFAIGVARGVKLVADTGIGWHTAMATVARNIIKGTVATAKWLYGVLSASWGWTLGVLAATLLVGVGVLGYVTL